VAWIEASSFELGRNPMAELDRLGSCHFNDAAPEPRTSLYQGQQPGPGIVHNKEARGRHRPARGNLRRCILHANRIEVADVEHPLGD
jgi:hypothetical protein